MNLALSLKFWLGLVLGAGIASLLLHGTATLASANGLAGLCLGAAIGMAGLVALITVRNRWATGGELED